jgi:hypothetical protein
MREEFAKVLQEGADDGLTNGEHIIRTLVQRAKEDDMTAWAGSHSNPSRLAPSHPMISVS